MTFVSIRLNIFDWLLKDFVKRFKPSDGVELGLVEEMLSAFWRQRRTWALETRTVDIAISSEPGEAGLTRLAKAFTNASVQLPLELIQRYETRLHRIFQRALSNLVVMRSLDEQYNLQNEPNPISEHSTGALPDSNS
jgi:hypothetical protein